MNGLLLVLSLLLFLGTALLVPTYGPSAVLLGAVLSLGAGVIIARSDNHQSFLLQIFIGGLLIRVLLAVVTFVFRLQDFFGPDALTYDNQGHTLLLVWQGRMHYEVAVQGMIGNFLGMPYLVAFVYALVGRNLLAVQLVNAVLGAATAPIIYHCTHHIFRNQRVARLTALLVAFFPSLVLWSSQGLKDGPIVFLLAVVMLATLKLGERLSAKYIVVLICALLGLLSLRFYIFYMIVTAIGGAFLIGMRAFTAQTLMRQFAIVISIGLALTYFGVLRTASTQLESFGSLERVQVSRTDLVQSAQSGFGKDVDVSTTVGAISAIPSGLVYLLFAPFPWQLTNLRQSITLPEMLIWWSASPLLVLGLWYTLKYRLRPALPILLFTTMLTLAYSIYQGNVGAAYRQRSQLLIFYFMFVAVGAVLLKERSENNRAVAH